jgi:hypothetical protein
MLLSITIQSNATGNISIRGNVRNSCGEPVTGAVIQVQSIKLQAITDSLGNFTIAPTHLLPTPQNPENHLQDWEKIEVFDVSGRIVEKILSEKNANQHPIFYKIMNKTMVLRITDSRGSIFIKVLPINSTFNIQSHITSRSGTFFKKNQIVYDTLSISCNGYATQIVPVSSISTDPIKILIWRNGAGYASYNEMLSIIDTILIAGTKAFTDSLLYSEAGYEWSRGNHQLATNKQCYLRANAIGFQSFCSITGTVADVSKEKMVFAGLDTQSLLIPLLTTTTISGGITLNPNTVIDKSSYIVMHHGFPANESRKQIEGIKYSTGTRPDLPLDSTALINYFQVLDRELHAQFADSIQSIDSLRFEKIPGQFKKVSNSSIVISSAISNCEIVSSGTLVINPETKMKECRCISKKVVINGGTTDKCFFYAPEGIVINSGSHNSQFLSVDSIIVKENVLPGPQSLWMLKKKDVAGSQIHFFSNKNLCGTVVSFCDTLVYLHTNCIAIDSGSVFKGYLLADREIFMHDVEIYGTVYAYMVTAYYNGVTYPNRLINMKLFRSETPLFLPLLPTSIRKIRIFEEKTNILCH